MAGSFLTSRAARGGQPTSAAMLATTIGLSATWEVTSQLVWAARGPTGGTPGSASPGLVGLDDSLVRGKGKACVVKARPGKQLVLSIGVQKTHHNARPYQSFSTV